MYSNKQVHYITLTTKYKIFLTERRGFNSTLPSNEWYYTIIHVFVGETFNDDIYGDGLQKEMGCYKLVCTSSLMDTTWNS